jgi:hypothetical protein
MIESVSDANCTGGHRFPRVFSNPAQGSRHYGKAIPQGVHSHDKPTVETIKMYVMAVGQGISWANTAAEKNNAPLYCQPAKFSMNGNNYIEILDKMIDTLASKTTAKDLDEFPVAMVLLLGLQQTFPCQAEKG